MTATEFVSARRLEFGHQSTVLSTASGRVRPLGSTFVVLTLRSIPRTERSSGVRLFWQLSLSQDAAMDRAETLKEIAEILELQEEAIKQHPPKEGVLYAIGRDALVVPLRPKHSQLVGLNPGRSFQERRLNSPFATSFHRPSFRPGTTPKATKGDATRPPSPAAPSLGRSARIRSWYFANILISRDIGGRVWTVGLSPSALRRLAGPILLGALILVLVRLCA